MGKGEGEGEAVQGYRLNDVYRPENATYMHPVCRIVQNQVMSQGLKPLSKTIPKLERNNLFIRKFSLERAKI